MKFTTTKINIDSISYFSPLVKDYQREDDFFKDFINAFPSFEAIANACETRPQFPLDREVLVDTLKRQYKGIECHEKVISAIDSLKHETTFTICTAHQPSIFTGHLYFIYKIIHAIKLAEECSRQITDYQFVPMFYIGSEDNDIDEIGLLHYQDKTYHWTSDEKGACGRMLTNTLHSILNEVLTTFNRQIPDEEEMTSVLLQAYNQTNTLAQGTRILVNYLFGEFGLVIIDGDDSELKKLFIPVLRKECLEQLSYGAVVNTNSKLAIRYEPQATAREINLFYLLDGLRERIQRKDDQWEVVNTEIQFDEASLLYEIEHFPERFSPNVILRPVYQETILPNVAFIGGGGELAYWLQLKEVFECYQTSYPIVCLRHSVMWMTKKQHDQLIQLKLEESDLFLSEAVIVERWFGSHPSIQQLELSLEKINEYYQEIENESAEVSSSLERSVKAHRAKAHRIHERMKTKFMALIKRNESEKNQQYQKLKRALFPAHGLQERHDNLLTWYKEFHQNFIRQTMKLEGSPKAEFYIYTSEQ